MKNLTSKDLKRIAEAKRILNDIGKADSESIARHTGYDIGLVEEALSSPVFEDLYQLFIRGEFALWAGILADEQHELSKLIARLGYDAVLRLKTLIYSQDEKVANAAVRTALEYNADLERPVVRHEITTRFTSEELDKAREVVRRLKEKKNDSTPITYEN